MIIPCMVLTVMETHGSYFQYSKDTHVSTYNYAKHIDIGPELGQFYLEVNGYTYRVWRVYSERLSLMSVANSTSILIEIPCSSAIIKLGGPPGEAKRA